MSTAFALGAVSAVLRQRIGASLTAAGVSTAVGGVTVSVTSPDRIPVGAQEPNRINVYLHRVSRNAGWANAGPPPRNANGDAVALLPTGLNLHYVVSAYGQDPFTTDILLGHAVAALADEPVLTRAAIRQALAPDPPDPSVPLALGDSRLADQIEAITVTPVSSGMEELSRLWSAFGAPLRPSVFYEVTTVLVEPRVAAASPPPVLTVGSAALAATGPHVDAVASDAGPRVPIVAGSTLVLTGRALAGDGVRVRLGGSDAPPTSTTARELRVPLADFVPAVRPGLAAVVVTHEVEFGDPPEAHDAASSDPIAVAIAPTLTFANGAVVSAPAGEVAGVPVASGTITATIAPPIGRSQHVVLLLVEIGAPADRSPRGTTLVAPAANGAPQGSETTATVTFTHERVPAGSYVARVRVDGVDSAMGQAADGTFDSPAVTL